MSQSPLIVKYEKAIAEDPRSRAFAPLAEAYRKVGLIDKAFEVLKKGIRYNPDYVMGYFSLSQCYFEKGEYALAYTTLRPISAKNRDNIKLQKLYGDVCCETRNFEEAVDTFKYLLFLNPKDEEISSKVQKLEAMLSESAILPETSEVTFEIDDLAPSPENDRALDDWVQVDLSRQSEIEDKDKNKGFFIESTDEWEQVVVLPESDAGIIEEVPSQLIEQEEEVGPLVETPDEEFDDTPVITHTLVDLYLNQGHKQKAIEILEKIIKIQPGNQESIERLALLRGPELEAESKESIESKNSMVSKDEGHSNLSAVLDEALSVGDVQEGNFEQIDAVLNDFLALIRTKSSEFSVKA